MPFTGREAVAAEKGKKLTKRLVQFALKDPQPLPYHNEPIYMDGRNVGYITSAGYSFTEKCAIGMGYVKHPEGVDQALIDGSTFEIEVADKKVPARARLKLAFIRCRDLQASPAARLQAFANELRRLRPHFAEAVDALVNRLVQSDAGATAPKLGEPMPEFLLPDEQGRLVRLYDLLGEGPVAIAFNRGQWCPHCRINVDALARAEEEVATEHRHIAAIVPDRQKFAMRLKSDTKAPFPVLTDVDGDAMSLGLAFSVGDQMKHMMVNSGWDPSVSRGTDNWTLPIPATFIVGTDGIVHARFVDPDYRTRMAIDDMLEALRSAR